MMKLKNCKTNKEKLSVVFSYVLTAIIIAVVSFCIIGSVIAFKLFFGNGSSCTLKASAESDLNFDNYYTSTYYCSSMTNSTQVSFPFRFVFPLNNNAAQQSGGLLLESYLNGNNWSELGSATLIPFNNSQSYWYNPNDFETYYDYLLYRVDISDLIGSSSINGYFTILINNRNGSYVHPFMIDGSVNGFVIEHSINSYPSIFSCEFFTLDDYNYYTTFFSNLELTTGQNASYFAPVRNSMKLNWSFTDLDNNQFDITVFCPSLFYNSSDYQGELDYEINFLKIVDSNTAEGSLYYNTVFNVGYSLGYAVGKDAVDASVGEDQFNRGYAVGHSVGYSEGLDTAFEDISPFAMISSGITSFLNMELFPGFKFSSVFLIAVGLILLGAFFKLFFHG